MLRVIWGCAWKDVRSALTERSTLLQSVTLPVNYLIMMSLFVLAGSHAPTAVVMNDHGPYARQFVTAMRQAHSFSLEVTSAAAARQQLRAGTLVAVVTIPAGFDQAVARHQQMAVPVQVNNLDEDLTNDAHRAMRLVVTQFYAHADPGLVSIVASEQDAFTRDTGYIPFLAMSIIVIALMVSGLLQAGNAASRDWENSTIKELLLAPARSWEVLAGRMLGAFLVALPAAVVVLAVVVFIVGDHPARLAVTCAVSMLTLAVFVAAGNALGTALKDRSTLAVLTRALPVPLFFLSGVFGPIGFQTGVVQGIAKVLPIHYAVVLEQLGFKWFTTSTMSPVSDAAILAGYLLIFIVLSGIALRLSRPAAARV
jgi:ABC-type multidrug transport system permease subunit